MHNVFLRVVFIVLIILGSLTVATPMVGGASITLNIPAKAGPWNQLSNLSRNYGVHDNTGPVTIKASDGIDFTTGATITVSYVGGLVTNGPGAVPVDANGQLQFPSNTYDSVNGRFPAFYMSPSPVVVYIELVGTFADDNGVIVGTPFALGNGPTNLTVPAGATQLQLGINDNLYSDNGGSFTVTVASGCEVDPKDVQTFSGDPNELDGKPTTMNAIFVPGATAGNPVGLTAKANACGFTKFDWVQVVDELPSPSPFFAQSNSIEVPDATQPIAIPPLSPIHDAPPGGYTYQFRDPLWLLHLPHFANAFPFYYSPLDVSSGCADWDAHGCARRIIPDNYTLIFVDRPKDPCIFGGRHAFTAACNYTATLNPGFIKFTTQLVGICGSTPSSLCAAPGMPSSPLFQWTWKSNFNGTSLGGVAETASGEPTAPGSGTGGITITSINGVLQVPPSATCTASPKTLWPPNGKSVSVTISGNITPGTQAIPHGGTGYVAIDEYGQVQPSATFALGADGSYLFRVPLIASRNGGDQDGRKYTVVVGAKDGIGNVGSCSVVVTVSHDQGQ